MINPIRYGGQIKKMKNGKPVILNIPPAIVLERMGAALQITIAHPRNIQAEFQKKGQKAPVVEVTALIDTGASSTVITPKIADSLGLIHTGYATVSSVQDEQNRPVYYGYVLFGWGRGKEIPLIACPLKMSQFDCLIGRDILKHWYMTYNGLDGSIVICD